MSKLNQKKNPFYVTSALFLCALKNYYFDFYRLL